MQKVIIFGFPHCGTTILQSIISHIEDVANIIPECHSYINESMVDEKERTKKFILAKCPYTSNEYFTSDYKTYNKIFIIRNPVYVYSSLNKRFPNGIVEQYHTLNDYITTVKTFNYYKENPMENLYLIRYEDIFDNNNFQKLREIFDSIGFKYTDQIFNNTEYKNYSQLNIELLDYKPDNKQHNEYRTWQINQPFVNNNDLSKIELTEKQKKIILESDDIRLVYPEISSLL